MEDLLLVSEQSWDGCAACSLPHTPARKAPKDIEDLEMSTLLILTSLGNFST